MKTQNSNSENIKVFVRVRPLLKHEIGKDEAIFIKDNSIRATDINHYYEGHFDSVFN